MKIRMVLIAGLLLGAVAARYLAWGQDASLGPKLTPIPDVVVGGLTTTPPASQSATTTATASTTTTTTVSTATLHLAPLTDRPSPATVIVPTTASTTTTTTLTAATDATPHFVFPDALDLRRFIQSAGQATPGTLRWSYFIVNSRYLINGIEPLDPSLNDPLDPGPFQINRPDLSGELNPDGNPNTITIRNNALAPLDGSPGATPGPGIQDGQVVTLFASDGTTYTETTLFIYTDPAGNNRLSGG